MRHSQTGTPKFKNGHNDRKRSQAAKSKTLGLRRARASKRAMFEVR